jgi:spermidine/putrescine transport system substrate-binding protein
MSLRTTASEGERPAGSRATRAVAGVLALLLIALAGGCGGSGGIESGNAKSGEQVDASGPVQGKLTISQWPLYIDPGKNGTINEFEDETGVQVDYIEDINDNNEFFGKLQPQLAKGESGGRDLITVSDWLAKQMYDAGYIQKLDYSKLPNVKQNLIPPLRHPAADPHREFTVPWQSGMTRLIVNTDLAPNVDSVCDLPTRGLRRPG